MLTLSDLPVIHPSAVIDPDARLAASVEVGPHVVIEADVVIGENVRVLAGCVLHAGCRVAQGCILGPYAVVGGLPMDSGFSGETSYAALEEDVVLREFVTVHRATGEGAETRVGRGTLAMSYAHISHNVIVGRRCTLTTSVQLGGHSQVGDDAVLGSGAMLHQFCRVGTHAMYGAGSASNQDVLPYSMARGNPAKHYRLNRVGLQRRGFTGERYERLEQAIRAFRRGDEVRLAELAELSDDVQAMLAFRDGSRRGLCSFV